MILNRNFGHQILYKNFNELKPSDFALFIVGYFEHFDMPLHILDVGCGNGRDSYFLSSKYNNLDRYLFKSNWRRSDN